MKVFLATFVALLLCSGGAGAVDTPRSVSALQASFAGGFQTITPQKMRDLAVSGLNLIDGGTVQGPVVLNGTLTTGAGGANGFLFSATTASVTGAGNANFTLRALGTGSLNFQTGATPFTGLQLIDPGASAVNFIRVQGHATGQGVDVAAVGDAAAVLNLKAGTSGTGGSVHVWTPMLVGALSQHNNFALGGLNPADLSTLGIVQLTTMTGTNGANVNTNGLNQFIFTDTAQVNGSMGLMTFSQNYATGADGPRNMMDEVFSKSASSASGNGTFELHRFFMHIDANEGGTGTTMTASLAANVLTVTAAATSVLQVGTIVSGTGVKPTKIVGLGTGTGGTGTYTVDVPQEVSSQAMVGGNYKGDAELMNPDLRCSGGDWWHGCLLAEWDMRAQSDVLFKTGIDLHYALTDSGHGVWVDCALCFSAGDYAPGVGKGHVLISVGTPVSTWPINTADPDSAIIRAQINTTRSTGANATQFKTTFGIDFTPVECATACWRSPGFTVDGDGQLSAGSLSVTYGAAGATLSAPRVTTASAVVVAGGGGFVLHDRVLEPLTGSIWDVASLGGSGAAATLALVHAGYAASCPPAATRFTSMSVGVGLTGTVTCSTSDGITVGSGSGKLAFYGATPIVKATPSGACAGNTGCQALRGALVNLGFINGGSISD
jgi:hypothetical protein